MKHSPFSSDGDLYYFSIMFSRLTYLFILFLGLQNSNLYAQATKIVLQNGHLTPFSTTIHPSGKLIATAGHDGRITIQDVVRAKVIYNQPIYKKAITCLSFTSVDHQLVLGTADSTILFFDPVKKTITQQFPVGFLPVEMCMNPKFNVVAVGGANGEIQVIDADKDYLKVNTGKRIMGLQFTSNGAILFVGAGSFVKAYAVNGGKEMVNIPMKETNVAGIQLTKDDQFLLIHMTSGLTEMIDVSTFSSIGSIVNNKVPGELFGYYYPVATQDGKYLISANAKNNIVVTNRMNKTTIEYNNNFSTDRINQIMVDPNGEFVLLTTVKGSSGIFYFDDALFTNECALLWRRLLYTPERIYRTAFTDKESISLFGEGWYEFNLKTGDLSRRDNDSLALGHKNYKVTYFALEKDKSTYYYVNYISGIGYKIKNNTEVLPFSALSFSADTSTVAFVLPDENKMIVYNIRDRKQLFTQLATDQKKLKLFANQVDNCFVLQSGKELLLLSNKGKIQKTFSLTQDQWLSGVIKPSLAQTMYLWYSNGKLSAYDFTSEKELALPKSLSEQQVEEATVTADGSQLALMTPSNLKLFDGFSGNLITNVPLPEEQLMHLCYSGDKKRIAVSTVEGLTRIYSTEDGKLQVNILASMQHGLLAFTDDMYYMATKEAARQIVLERNGDFLSLENAEMEFNRPDKVLSQIGLSDQRLINAYSFAYKKRLQKVKSATCTGSPSVTLTNTINLKSATTEKKQELIFSVNGNGHDLSRFQIWQNGVPVLGKKGAPLTGSTANYSYQLDLLSGTNHITYCAYNTSGAQSDKQQITITNTSIVKPNVFVLTVGTSTYHDARYNLNYAAKDAEDIASLFKNVKTSEHEFNQVFTQTLVNEKVTKENMQKVLDFMQKAKPDDVFVLFVAGHGVRDTDMNYYFATYDMDFDHPEKNGFSEEDLEVLLDKVVPLKRLVFFDTCLSGEMDKEEAEQVAQVSNTSVSGVQFRTAGAGLRAKASGIQNANALMREIYTDLSNDMGSTIISSAGGFESAMESAAWKNGLFTYCFLRGLKEGLADLDKNKSITISELHDYVRTEVFRLSKGTQHPSMKSENTWMDFKIW